MLLRTNETDARDPDFFRDVLIGITDGLTIPFALATGLSGAFDNSRFVAVAGLITIAAGSIAIGLGSYLSTKSEEEHEFSQKEKELAEITKAKTFFANIGLSPELQEKVAAEIVKNNDRWLEFTKKYETGVYKPGGKSAQKSGLIVCLSYIVGGSISIVPYFLIPVSAEALPYSAVITIICLFLFGYFKSKISGNNGLWGAVRLTLIGAVAAAAAFGVANLFEH